MKKLSSGSLLQTQQLSKDCDVIQCYQCLLTSLVLVIGLS